MTEYHKLIKNQLTDSDKEVLSFIHARLKEKYSENENIDYMIRLKNIYSK